jgi:hypothetical protein
VAHPPPARTPIARRGLGERALAWLYTGPLGALWSALADISAAWLRWAGGRVRERVARRLAR